MEDKQCLACNKVLRGRIDKKFCDDYCRNNYNNQLNSDATNLVRNINNALRKNRRVLENVLNNTKDGAKETAKISKEKLNQLGFSFTYFTNVYKSKQGNVYYFVYEFGYMALENDWFLIVHRKEEKS
jgi:hypothetical protein